MDILEKAAHVLSQELTGEEYDEVVRKLYFEYNTKELIARMIRLKGINLKKEIKSNG